MKAGKGSTAENARGEKSDDRFIVQGIAQIHYLGTCPLLIKRKRMEGCG